MVGNEGAIAPKTGEVYYSGKYWNDFPVVVTELNMRATGNPKETWYDHFFTSQKRSFKKVLMLNCGNGWVEREMYKKGYIGDLVGVDFSEDLLAQARQKTGKRPFHYYRMDINTAEFPETGFDLVINHAAAHHIAYLNKVFCQLDRIMTDDGVFLNYDYVGPHRNQYHLEQWHAVHNLNNSLPERSRQNLSYPHLPTMLVTDPSEAIHSELILPIMRRYFTIDHFRPVGGALAYILLTHNEALQQASKKDVTRASRLIMQADSEYTQAFPDSTMFAYWYAHPNKAALKNHRKLTNLQAEEDAREATAKKRGGHYYDLSLIQQLYLELDELRIARQHKQSSIEELQQQNDALQQELVLLKRSLPEKAIDRLRQVKQKVATVTKRR